MKKNRKAVIEAAGGIVYRRRPDGDLEFVVIHRPRYDDWTLPKGKLEKGETRHEAAVREVEEETGLRVERVGPFAQTSYRDSLGRLKIVSYYYMTTTDGRFEPNDEVDELRWLTVEEAVRTLSYARDKDMIAAVARDPRI